MSLRFTFLKRLSSETAGLIEARLIVEPPWDVKTVNLFKYARLHDQNGFYVHIC